MELSYEYFKLRRDCGRQPMFCETPAVMCDNIPTDITVHRSYILRNPVHQFTQHTPNYAMHDMNTIRAEYANSGMNHEEGGWPKDVNIHDIEQTQRYRRKVEKDDPYIHCIMQTSKAMEHYILQNNAIEMYETYFSDMGGAAPLEHIGCRTVNVYREPSRPTRPVCSISWQPGRSHKFAVTYNDIDFYRNPRFRSLIESYVWDIENANLPVVTFQPPCALVDFQFNDREDNILAGGLVNGQVGIWDLRTGGEAASLCEAHVAHRDIARNVIFISAKSGQEFFSGSADGSLRWWDVRNLSDFIDEMIMDMVKISTEVQSMATACGVATLEFEHTIPTRFLVGTEDGFIIGGNRKGKTPLEKLPFKFPAHLGPIISLERNPGFLKNFLTVGDWTARVWSEDCRESAVLWSPPHRHKLTAGTWSPTRLSMMMLTQKNGMLTIWDLLRRQTEPVLSTQVCKEPLLRLRAHIKGSLVACGSSTGTIYMQEVSESLQQSEPQDKVLMTHLFEREAKRERILEARMREIRLKQRQAEEGVEGGEEPDIAAEAAIGNKDLAEAANIFVHTVKRELDAM